ncbi:MAG: hypothetical protein GX951_01210 [Mollicutes bacterium]|nr:hypothetical protein [Mollicutes bacterium]
MIALCVGHSAYDFIVLSNDFPLENSKTSFNDVYEGAGGTMSNVSYLLGKYGIETYLASVIGDDTFGNIIKRDLEKVGVHTEYIETAYGKRTHLAFIIINKTEKTRTVYKVAKDDLLLKKTDFPINPDVVIVDSKDYGASLVAINKFKDKITILDAEVSDQNTLELCKYSKYILASKTFAESVAGDKIDFNNAQSMVTVFSKLVNKFPGKEIVVTIEDKGALYMINGQIKVMPGIQVEAIDTTGAGDIFHASFAYALCQGYDLEKTITFANIAAGLSTTKVGVHASVPELSDIMAYFKQKYPDTVTTQTNVATQEQVPSSQ